MAEAVAVISLAASIASLIDISVKVGSRVKDFTEKTSDVPECFRAFSNRLPLQKITLQGIQSQAEADPPSEDEMKALETVIKDTTKRVATIQTSLFKVRPSDDASKLERALKALKSLAKEDKMRQVLEEISEDFKVLNSYQGKRNGDKNGRILDKNDRILELLSRLNITTTPTPPNPSSNIPFRRDPDFVDRGTILDQLDKKCAVPASRTALIGLGGIGKSQLAIEFGHRTREQSPSTWVLWVYAGSIARLEQSFRDIADRIEIPGRQDPETNVYKLVHDWIASGKIGRWLLILDNVDETHFLTEVTSTEVRNTEVRSNEVGSTEVRSAGTGRRDNSIKDKPCRQPISAFFPQSQNGSILITSRSKAVVLKLLEEKDIILVDSMTPLDAHALFEKKLGSVAEGLVSEGDDPATLLKELDYMPLAIVQAAAYISQRAPRYSVRRYLEALRKGDRKKASLLNHEGGHLQRDSEAQNSIIITWQISFEHIQRNRPSAADLLSLMSFCDRHGIPEFLVRNLAGTVSAYSGQQRSDESDSREEREENEESISECSDDAFEDDIQMLRNYSFLSFDDKDQSFEMHTLVQLATRKWLEANAKFEQWCQRYIRSLSAEFPTGEYDNWTQYHALFPHAKSVFTQRPQNEESLKEWASLMYHAACSAQEKGNISDAVNLSESAMETRKKLLGEKHRDTLDSIGVVGDAYLSAGRLKEAEKLCLQEVELCKHMLGEEHPKTLTSEAKLAIIYRDQERWMEAEAIFLRILEMRRRIFGEEHNDTVSCIAGLASTYFYQQNLAEALRLQERATEICTKVLGEDHPDTLSSTTMLSVIYGAQWRWAEAETLQKRALEIETRIRGEEHPHTLASMNLLANTYLNQRRFAEAEKLQLQGLEIQKRTLTEEHPDTLTTMNNMAANYSKQGRLADAVELILHVTEIKERVLGEEHRDTLTSMNNLVGMYVDQGRCAEAEELQERIIGIRKRTLGEDHPSTLRGRSDLAWIYAKRRRSKEAEELQLQIKERMKRVLGEEHPETLNSMDKLFFLYWDQERWTEAEKILVRVMELRKIVLGKEHPDTLISMSNLAYIWKLQGRNAEATDLMDECLHLKTRVLGEEHPETLTSMNNLALNWCEQGRNDKAVDLIDKCLRLRTRILGEKHPDTLTSMNNLARIWHAQGRNDEAVDLMDKCLHLRTRILGANHPDTLDAMNNLACILHAQGRNVEAVDLMRQCVDLKTHILGADDSETLRSVNHLTEWQT